MRFVIIYLGFCLAFLLGFIIAGCLAAASRADAIKTRAGGGEGKKC